MIYILMKSLFNFIDMIIHVKIFENWAKMVSTETVQ